jgi:TonB family protein
MKLKQLVLVIALVAISPQVRAQDSSTDGLAILSDTYGYDFGPYLKGVTTKVRQNWYALVPEVARKGQKGQVVVTFTIVRDGKIQDLRVRSTSGSDVLDRASTGAVAASSPLQALPADFKGEQLALQLTFTYNIK